MFLKDSAMESKIFYLKEGTGVRCLCKNVLLDDLLGSQYLPEISQTSLTFKNSENMEKNDCFKKIYDGDNSISF